MNLYAAADYAINTQVAATQITGSKNVFHKYLPVSELLPDSLFVPPVRVEDEDDCDTDTSWIDTDSRPGSKRVADYANHYQNNGDKSAFVLNDEELSDRMVSSLIAGDIDLQSPLGKVLAKMMVECVEETGELADA